MIKDSGGVMARFFWLAVVLVVMVVLLKCQRNDELERAYKDGYEKALLGHSDAVAPRLGLDSREEWLKGWRDGKAKWDGV